MDKKEIRKAVRERLGSLEPAAAAAASERIFASVAEMPEFAAARTVALYMSLRGEPRTEPLLREWQGRKRLVVPRVCGSDMEFFDYDPAAMLRGSFGIAEPDGSTPQCRTEDIDLMIVPAVAYTRDGVRLGRGGGYYDRYMSRPGFRAFKVGVCFGVQIADELPAEPHDVRVDRVAAAD